MYLLPRTGNTCAAMAREDERFPDKMTIYIFDSDLVQRMELMIIKG